MLSSKWGVGAVLLALLVGGVALWPVPEPAPRPFDGGSLPPRSSLRVLWIGHSLMNHRDPHVEPSENLLEVVGRFAGARSLGYAAVDHTLFGSPLSLLWRGRPHSYPRSEPEMAQRRAALLEEAATLDAVVLTEGLPVGRSLELEHSAYYAQEFRCTVTSRNPQARVFVYEAWSHLFASDPDGGYPPPSTFDWLDRLASDRAHVERLADLAATGQVPEPGWLARFTRLGSADRRCAAAPVYLVPVGTAFRELGQLLTREELLFDDRALHVRDLFANPYTSWPAGWPLPQAASPEEEAARLAELSLRHPDEPLDDVHPSQLGVYVAALVHFATLFGQSPVGLPHDVVGLPEATARRLQELVWDVVRRDPRTGVEGGGAR